MPSAGSKRIKVEQAEQSPKLECDTAEVCVGESSPHSPPSQPSPAQRRHFPRARATRSQQSSPPEREGWISFYQIQNADVQWQNQPFPSPRGSAQRLPRDLGRSEATVGGWRRKVCRGRESCPPLQGPPTLTEKPKHKGLTQGVPYLPQGRGQGPGVGGDRPIPLHIH